MAWPARRSRTIVCSSRKRYPGRRDGGAALLVEQPRRRAKSLRLHPQRIRERASSVPGRVVGGCGRQTQEFRRPSG